MPIGEGGTYETKVNKNVDMRKKEELRWNTDEEKHLNVYEGLREGKGMGTYLYGPMDHAKMLELRFWVGDLDLQREERALPAVGCRRK